MLLQVLWAHSTGQRQGSGHMQTASVAKHDMLNLDLLYDTLLQPGSSKGQGKRHLKLDGVVRQAKAGGRAV